jgi:hypothetical protein
MYFRFDDSHASPWFVLAHRRDGSQISRLHTGLQVPLVIPPSEGLVYRLLVAHTAMPVSRLCGALVSYKSEFEELKQKVGSAEDLSAQSAQLNYYIWDFAVALLGKLFAPANDPATGMPTYKDTLGLPECVSSP